MKLKKKTIFLSFAALVFLAGGILFTYFALTFGPGTTGRIQFYTTKHSKREVNQALKRFFAQYPEYVVPLKFRTYVKHFGYRDISIDPYDSMRGDSTDFHFFLQKENMVIRTRFQGGENDWVKKWSTLALEGYVRPDVDKWQFNKDLSSEERARIKELFEREVLQKIPSMQFEK